MQSVTFISLVGRFPHLLHSPAHGGHDTCGLAAAAWIAFKKSSLALLPLRAPRFSRKGMEE